MDKSDIRLPQAILKGEEHHHLSRVARVRHGHIVWLFDREGASYRARVEKIEANQTQLIVLERSQRGRSSIPELHLPVTLKNWLEQPQDVYKLVLWEDGDRYLKDVILSELSDISFRGPTTASVVILVGSEGGWTKGEQKDILEHGYKAVALGDNILRAETAAIISLAIISYFWNT